MPASFDPYQTIIAGVPLMFVIIGLIEFIKGFFPEAPGRLWLALAFFFGFFGQLVSYRQMNGDPATFDAWVVVVVLGLLTGLAAAKAYDESVGKRPYRRGRKLAPVFQAMDGAPLAMGADGALYDMNTPRGSGYDYASLAAASAALTKTTTAVIPPEPDRDEYDLSGIMDDLDESDGARGPA